MQSFQESLNSLNKKTLKGEDVLCENRISKKQMDELLHLKKQVDQQKLQREKENQSYMHHIQKKDREYEYNLNEAKEK